MSPRLPHLVRFERVVASRRVHGSLEVLQESDDVSFIRGYAAALRGLLSSGAVVLGSGSLAVSSSSPPLVTLQSCFFFDCLSWFGVLRRGPAPQRLRVSCSSCLCLLTLRFAPSVSRLVLALFDSRRRLCTGISHIARDAHIDRSSRGSTHFVSCSSRLISLRRMREHRRLSSHRPRSRAVDSTIFGLFLCDVFV